jgi:hypothetical protein
MGERSNPCSIFTQAYHSLVRKNQGISVSNFKLLYNRLSGRQANECEIVVATTYHVIAFLERQPAAKLLVPSEN